MCVPDPAFMIITGRAVAQIPEPLILPDFFLRQIRRELKSLSACEVRRDTCPLVIKLNTPDRGPLAEYIFYEDHKTSFPRAALSLITSTDTDGGGGLSRGTSEIMLRMDIPMIYTPPKYLR